MLKAFVAALFLFIPLSAGAANATEPSLPPPTMNNTPAQSQPLGEYQSEGVVAAARLADAFKTCRVKRNVADRVVCFDALGTLVDAISAPPQVSSVNRGGWLVTMPTDRDGVRSVVASIDAFDVTTDDDFIQKDKRSSLFVRCRAGQTSAYFVFPRQMSGPQTHEMPVTISYDDSEELDVLIPSLEGNALGFWTSARSTEFTLHLLQIRKLSLRVPFGDGHFVRVSFDTVGSQDALAQLRTACRW